MSKQMEDRNDSLTFRLPMEFNYIFYRSCRVGFKKVLCKYSRDELIKLAVLLNREYCNQPPQKLCQMLSSNDSKQQDLFLRIESFLKKSLKRDVEYVAATEITTLELLRRAFSIPLGKFRTTNNPLNVDRLQFQTIKLITQINEESMKFHIGEKDKEDLSVLYYINSASHHDISNFNEQNEFIAQTIQAVKFFKLLERESKYKNLLLGFYNAYTISNWREYLRTLLSLFGISRKGEGYIPNDLNIDVDSLMTRSVLDRLSISSEENNIPYSSKSEYDQEGNSDYKMFRDRPLFKLTNGDYVIYNRSFLIDRLYSSLYFDFKKIVAELEGKQPNISHLFTSDFIEKTLFVGLMNECLSHNVTDALDEAGLKCKYQIKNGELGYPDFYLKTDNAVMLFECKDIRINAWIKEQRNYTLIEEELKNKLVSKTYQLDYSKCSHKIITPKKIGCGQIAGHVSNIRKGIFPWNTSLSSNIKVYPVLVIADNRLHAPGLAQLLRRWYYGCLQSEGLQTTLESPLILMSPLTLIKYSAIFKRDGFQKYFDEYYDSISAVPADIVSTLNHQISFDDYMQKYPFYLEEQSDLLIKELRANRKP